MCELSAMSSQSTSPHDEGMHDDPCGRADTRSESGGLRAFIGDPLQARFLAQLRRSGSRFATAAFTSICPVRRLETDVAHRVHMLRRKFVRGVLVAVGADKRRSGIPICSMCSGCLR